MNKYLVYFQFINDYQGFLDGEYEENYFDEEMIMTIEAKNADEAGEKLNEWIKKENIGLVHFYIQYTK